MADEPEAKKAKTETGWEGHTLNCAEALMKDKEGLHFSEIVDIADLQGIGPHSERVLKALGVSTVPQLATYKFFLMARALATLAETEGKRLSSAVMNVDKAVDKDWESKTFKEIVEGPVSCLEGLTEDADSLLKDLGVKTVGDLATLKYCRWAEAMVLLGEKYENTKTAAERKKERELSKLS